MNRMLVVAVSVTLLLAACGSETAAPGAASSTTTDPAASVAETPRVQRFWILPDTVECQGEMVQRCMQVAQSEDGEYLYFYDAIDGFTFEEGTKYVIDVEITEVEDPPADASSLAYRLVEVIERSN